MITDLNYLSNMSGGNNSVIKEMITIFVEQVQEYIVDMQKYLAEGDYISIGKLSHKAKSSVAIMGMNDLAAQLKILELLSKEGKEQEKYPEMVSYFVDQCQGAIVELLEKQSQL